ncbi:MAG: transglycosylase SLT domain-containing protein [Terracidiphilus sp.]
MPTGRALLVLPLLAIALAGCGPEAPVSASNPQLPQATAPAIPASAAVYKPTQAATLPQPSSGEQQRVHDLIQQVEAAYALGDADYKKGMLAEAKVEFDRAVDLMLSSGIDIRGNQQLSDEFDQIVDQVNGLEMEALKQGNGFVPKEEETPADVASDVTFAVDPNLVAKARADLATTKSDLPLVMNDYIAAYINFFAYTQRGHNTLLHSFERAGRYKAMIQRVLADEGVPQDLIYLAVAESGFQPRAMNPRSRAGGMWQFMPRGNYGLERNQYVDERFDPEKSTRAYARYMKYIYDQLGDWYLAMAAYDHGAGNIQREVQRTGYADFWELYKRHELPTETANYVPEILAAIIIANHPTQYGFDEVTLDPPVLTDTVTVNYSIDLRLVSDLVGAPIDELEALNPSLLRMVTPPESSFDLHLPAGTADLFNQRVDFIPEAHRNSWRYHAVAAGDTVASVANEYRVRPAELAGANQLAETDSLEGKDAVIVPVAPELAPSTRMAWYITRRGDTLVTIADRFGVSLAQLRRWNNLTGTKVEPGRRLHVAEPVVQAHRSSRRRHASASGGRTGATGTQKGTGTGTAGRQKKASEKTASAPAAKSEQRKTDAGATHKRSQPASNPSQK